MRIEHALVVAIALACGGCANLTTQDRFSNLLRLTCDARSNAEITTLKARISAMDAKDPKERLDLALADRLSIRSGKYGAGLAWHTDMMDMHDGNTTVTHAYEAAIPTGPTLEIGFKRWEFEAEWAPVLLPTAPELTLIEEGQRRLTWPPSSSGTQDSLEIFVACDDGALPKDDPNADPQKRPRSTPGIAGRYKPPTDEGGIDVASLLSLVKTRSTPSGAADWTSCQSLSIVVARSATVTIPGTGFGAVQCAVESSRGITLPPRNTLTVPTEGAR